MPSIDLKSVTPERRNWQKQLAGAIRDPDELIDRLRLPDQLRDAARKASEQFGLVVPRCFVDLMEPGNADDPLLRQVLPLAEELARAPGFEADPVADSQSCRASGLLQKYASRALLLLNGTCAINCRFCFRRHYPYETVPRGYRAWSEPLKILSEDRSIEEVILSGGDPLAASDEWLAGFVSRLEELDHLRRLRIHSRLPVVLPDRVDESLLDWINQSRLQVIVVLHCNHPRELSEQCRRSVLRLANEGVMLLNQSVLLRGVNDDLAVLRELSLRLIELRVVPYYLHQLDRVSGAGHFEVSPEVGKALIEGLRARLPGYAVPRYVREVAGEANKVVLD